MLYISRLEKESQTIPRVLDYKIWNFTDRELVIRVNFSDPLFVSSQGPKDQIDLVFLMSSLFQARSDGHLLRANYTITRIEVPK